MNVGVIGLGLIGGSIALKIKKIDKNTVIYGLDKDLDSMSYSLSKGIIDKKLDINSINNLKYIFIAIPVDAIKSEIESILNKISNNTLVVDLGSTKYEICKKVQDHSNRKNFLAAHPIAGTEFSGPSAAINNLFDNKVLILCETERTDQDLLSDALKIFDLMNMNIINMDSIEHDKHIAYVSHLSHISSFMLGKTVMNKEKDQDTIYDMAGSGFESTVRLAKSSPETWASIFVENKKNILESLNEYISNINNFKTLIENGDKEKLSAEMKKINGIKEILNGIK
jgi:prephenate dehydrogenase